MEVTPEMRHAVRVEECAQRGHSYDLIFSNDSDVPHTIICGNCGKSANVVQRDDSAFERVVEWLRLERDRYQTLKWDYAEEDIAHTEEGLDEESWMWVRGVENYTSRIRLARGADPEWWKNPIAVQALLKLVATLASMPEHLLRAGRISDLPEPGHSSGEIREWKT